MSAEVTEVYNGYCPDCATGSGPHDDFDDAQAWADEHDKENHE